LRCAEVTMQHGYRYLTILDSGAQAKKSYVGVSSAAVTSDGRSAGGVTVTNPSSSIVSASCKILCYNEKPSSVDDSALLDAEFLGQSLSSKYGLCFENGRVVK